MPEKIRSYTYDEFIERVREFHGFPAPGVLIGGFMVDLAYRSLPDNQLYNALCETPKCLPDAVQLLTPCTIGNGWLTVINLGRYALSMYEKSTGIGVRVFIDPARLDKWPEIKAWFFKTKSKKEQDFDLLLKEVGEAAGDICGSACNRSSGQLTGKEPQGDVHRLCRLRRELPGRGRRFMPRLPGHGPLRRAGKGKEAKGEGSLADRFYFFRYGCIERTLACWSVIACCAIERSSSSDSKIITTFAISAAPWA